MGSANGQAARPPVTLPAVGMPIRVMMAEHEAVGVLLGELVTATRAFTPPDDACSSYRALYRTLTLLRQDLLRHIALENHVLFPRAIELDVRRAPEYPRDS